MACKVCGDQIFGWVTYREEWIDNRCHSYVACCYKCTNHDPAMTSKEKGGTVDVESQMRTLGRPVRPFQSVHKLLAKLQDRRGSDQPLPSILGVGEEREESKLVLPDARADPAQRSKTIQSRL